MSGTRLRLRLAPGARRPAVRIVSGLTARDRIVALDGIDPAAADRRLSERTTR
jgi:uncharacterized protein YggU (UPF0235/DUF167 family)